MKICACPTSTCDSCYQIFFSYCPSSLTFHTSFSMVESLYVWLQDKFGNVYMQPLTTNVDGTFTLDMSQYPNGMFNYNAGFFYMYLTTDYLGKDLVTIPYGVSPALSCIVFCILPANYIITEGGCDYIISEDTKYLITE